MMAKAKQLRPFIPSGENYDLAVNFFVDLGFTVEWEADGLAQMRLGEAVFLLQEYHNQEMQENLMLQLQVDSLDDWWAHLQTSGVLERYPGVKAKPPQDFPWGVRELHLIDPAGVCWHLSE